MKFHDWETYYQIAGKTEQERLGGNPETFYDCVRPTLEGSFSELELWLFDAEQRWYRNMRPYYKAWPGIITSLIGLNLNMKSEEIPSPKFNEMAVRFCDNDNGTIASMFFEFEPVQGGRQLGVRFSVNGEPRFIQGGITLADGRIIQDAIDCAFDNASGRGDVEYFYQYTRAIKIALTIAILADDPSIIEPDVLSKDELAYERTKDQKYVDKARRRGKVGWHIGKTFESMPHYRRPHPALFHTGKGRAIPRIVFRSGCVVHREKMTKVPTGYITPEGVEVEP
jgi:hypothetical protein